ncbi:wd g-beta repeat protein [Cystoisospora suis]|uniref:Cilia- and flagella-associated protein 251 n=1 Tax=Cystoisospora suis TaxID=483139 RepID=A0A2C6KYH8_9APIC|nr:wd g-beta repeat protein [Cystoisospora suis]
MDIPSETRSDSLPARGDSSATGWAQENSCSNSVPPIALSLSWSYGYDKDLIGGVHSLSRADSDQKAIFFVSGTTGVIFSYGDGRPGQQTLLQGHVNAITAVAISEDKKRIVTADSGEAVDITPDSRFIVSLSSPIPPELIVESSEAVQEAGLSPGSVSKAGDSRKASRSEEKGPAGDGTGGASERSSYTNDSEGSERTDSSAVSSRRKGSDGTASQRSSHSQVEMCHPRKAQAFKAQTYQSVAVWDWSTDRNSPVAIAVIATPDVQHSVLFNRTDVEEILTNGKRRVFFWFWERTSDYFHFYSPALQAKDFKQKIGDFTRSIFLPNSTKAATGTVDGDVVLWDLSLIVDGFYDFQFRITRWFDDLNVGQINSISFEYHPIKAPPVSPAPCREPLAKNEDKARSPAAGAGPSKLQVGQNQKDMEAEGEDEEMPSFIVSTAAASVVQMASGPWSAIDGGGKKQWRYSTVFQGVDAAVRGIATHPNLPLIGVCCTSGYVKLWDYHTHSLIVNHCFEKLSPNVRVCPAGKAVSP